MNVFANGQSVDNKVTALRRRDLDQTCYSCKTKLFSQYFISQQFTPYTVTT